MSKLWLLERLDRLYHKSGNHLPLRWACDAYDNALSEGIEEALRDMTILADMAQRCPKCEGYDFPGVSHNRAAAECSEYDRNPFLR